MMTWKGFKVSKHGLTDVLSQHLLGGSEEVHEKPLSGQPVA
jgi:hypothetical protein